MYTYLPSYACVCVYLSYRLVSGCQDCLSVCLSVREGLCRLFRWLPSSHVMFVWICVSVCLSAYVSVCVCPFLRPDGWAAYFYLPTVPACLPACLPGSVPCGCVLTD